MGEEPNSDEGSGKRYERGAIATDSKCEVVVSDSGEENGGGTVVMVVCIVSWQTPREDADSVTLVTCLPSPSR
ncbi:hypothetical protein ACFX15_045378 [Malus domestica]